MSQDQARAALYTSIVQALIKARKSAGIRQVELAERLGKHQSFVSKYENGERTLDVAEFVLVARAIGSDPSELLVMVVSSSDLSR